MVTREKKKLLITASTFPRWEGDTEPRFVLDLAKKMLDTYEITVLVPAAIGAKETEILEGVKVVRYHYFPIKKWETLCYPGAIVPRIRQKKTRIFLVPFLLAALWWKLFRIISDYDLVHAHWLIPQGIIQSFFNKPYIVTGHGGDVTSLNQGFLRKLKIRCLKRAKYITVVSEFLKQEINILYNTDNISVIPMGCDITQFGKKFYESNYFSQGNQKVILFVGRLAEKKGVSYLLKAMNSIDALLIIVGDGPLMKELKQQALTLKDKVLFLGAKTHAQLKTIYASADIFVMPSVTAEDGDKEGFGLVMLEAMSSGLPVIASKSGGIPSLVKDGVNGLLFEEKNVSQLCERINLLLENQELYKELQYNAQITSEQYDYKVISDKYLKIYQK